jgi:hypothetical protein
MAERPNYQRTINVCRACRVNKKGCDRKLPTCSACSRKKVQCVYRNRRKSRLSAEDIDSPQSSSQQTDTTIGSPVSGKDLSTTFQARLLAALKQTGRTSLQLRDTFFQSLHCWLPIVPPWQLSSSQVSLHNGATRIDKLMLLLAISVLDDSTSGSSGHSVPSDIYLLTRGLYAEAMVHMPVTASLVQSGILLATYEFAIKRSELAYITIRTAGSMYQILRSTTPVAMPQSTEAQELEKAEMYNTSRGLVIMHMYLCPPPTLPRTDKEPD